MKRVFIVVGVVLLAIGGFMGVQYFISGEQPPSADSTNSENNYTIEEIPVNSLEELAPPLGVPVVFDPSIPPDARSILGEKIAATEGRLVQKPENGGDWLELAVFYHSAGDYAKARAVWEFLVVVLPGDTVVLDNLGKLHHYQLKDFPRSEEYFKQSIVVNAASLVPYLELHTLYRYSYKTETTLAVDILRDALEQFPSEFGLYTTLASYYRDLGRVGEARAVLLEGIDSAREAGSVEALENLGNALESLPL